VRPVALTIAGVDPSGGAGIAADLRAFAAAGVWGAAVPTLVTAQGTRGVRAVHVLPPRVVARAIDVVLEDLEVAAVKTGALGSANVVHVVARALGRLRAPIVVDPVIRATRGRALLDRAGVRALQDELIGLAAIVTPNVAEAAILSGVRVHDADSARHAAQRIRELGAQAVLVKGGHLRGARARDLLVDSRGEAWLSGRRWRIRLHGAGCALSAAIAAHLARGASPREAARAAKSWVAGLVREARSIGPGLVPLG